MDPESIKSITPDPVIDSVVELRFKAKFPNTAVVGMIYGVISKLLGENPQLKGLPVSEIPEQIRKINPAFSYKPTHQMDLTHSVIRIGHDVITISGGKDKDYIGWSNFSVTINDVAKALFSDEIIDAVERVGVRYISFLDNTNIFKNIKISITQEGDDKIVNNDLSYVTQLKSGDVTSRLSIQNNVKIPPNKTGSIVDVDSYNDSKLSTVEEVLSTIAKCHTEEKRVFFSLLKPEYLESLKPEYKK